MIVYFFGGVWDLNHRPYIYYVISLSAELSLWWQKIIYLPVHKKLVILLY